MSVGPTDPTSGPTDPTSTFATRLAVDLPGDRRRIQKIPSRERRLEMRCNRNGHPAALVAVVTNESLVTRWAAYNYAVPTGDRAEAICDSCESIWDVSMDAVREAVDRRGRQLAKVWIQDVGEFKRRLPYTSFTS